MRAIDLLCAVGAAQDEYILDACFTRKRSNTSLRCCLIAAILALLLLLMGCAVWHYRMEQLIVIDHTTAEQASSPYVAQQVLSMQGYESSPAYSALQEWLEYETDYIIQHPECRFQEDFHRPDAYEIYPCYTQEMVDKVDALCQQYGLHLMGKATFLNNESRMAEYGLTRILSPEAVTRCFYGNLYEDGSFTADGELVLSGDYDRIVQFQMHNIRKDAFFPVTLGINGLSTYTQWNYRTKDGFQALMALKDNTGFIITENEDSFITVIIGEVPDANMEWHGFPDDKAFLETVCGSFLFS